MACSVRGCALELKRGANTWRCGAGHTFDIARSGYVNLIQPQDRRSLAAGDSREAARARRELLDAGFGRALRVQLERIAGRLALAHGARIADLGCGEGHYLSTLCSATGAEGYGIDLSVHALELAARRHRSLTWIAANADRRLPLLDSSIDLALSVDGRRNWNELARVLVPGGRLLLAVPAVDDLVELRRELLKDARPLAGLDGLLAECAGWFDIESSAEARETLELDAAQVEQLALATYRWQRSSELERLAGRPNSVVTSAHELLVFRRPITRSR